MYVLHTRDGKRCTPLRDTMTIDVVTIGSLVLLVISVVALVAFNLIILLW
jgi:hypothetical protein